MGIDKDFSISSRDFPPTGSRSAQRVLEMCVHENANVYVNAQGGVDLYDRADFLKRGIDLLFLNPQFDTRPGGPDFRYDLSILHVLMSTSVADARSLLEQYTLE